MNSPGASSLGTRTLVADGTENSTLYLPLVGPSASGTLYCPSFTLASTLVPLGSIAMKRIVPLDSGLPFSVTFPSSLPRLGSVGPRSQPTDQIATAIKSQHSPRIGGSKISQRIAGAHAAGGHPREQADIVADKARAAVAHRSIDAIWMSAA